MLNRFFALSTKEKATMLKEIGVESLDELYNGVPKNAFAGKIGLGHPMPESELVSYMQTLESRNFIPNRDNMFLGAGCYNHYIPHAVHSIVNRAEYITAYTPYQPEISQGLLSAMFEFQSMIARLTGMDIANGSMYDGATSLSEAALMSCRINGKNSVFISGNLHPHYKAVLESTLESAGMYIVDNMSDDVSCIIAQKPDFLGNIPILDRTMADKHGALLVVVVTEILSLGLLPAPVEADVVVGDAQSIATNMSFGGPHIGFFACKKEYMRQIPGRVCGETVDSRGQRVFTLTLSAREQHIKRERATSNICTNQFLLALAFTIHAALLGEIGYKKLALLNHHRCTYFETLVKQSGIKAKVLNQYFFNEISLELPFDANEFANEMLKHGLIAGHVINSNTILIAVTEMNSIESIERYVSLMCEYSRNFVKI